MSTFDYVPVEKLLPGQTIVNLGIIKNVFCDQTHKIVKLTFNPSRSHAKGAYHYFYGDKLMIA